MKEKNEPTKYDSLLDLFTAESSIREFYLHPYVIGDNVYATNGCLIIRIHSRLLGNVYHTTVKEPYKSDTEKIFSYFHLSAFGQVILLADLTEAVSHLPTEEEEEEFFVPGESEECPECCGTGNVEWTYSDSEGYSHYDYFECPVCEGSGYAGPAKSRKTGRLVTQPSSSVGILGRSITYEKLCPIIQCIEHLSLDYITLVTLRYGVLCFHITDGVDLAIASYSSPADYILIDNKININTNF